MEGCWGQTTGVKIQLLPMSCADPDIALFLTESQSPHLQDNDVLHSWLCGLKANNGCEAFHPLPGPLAAHCVHYFYYFSELSTSIYSMNKYLHVLWMSLSRFPVTNEFSSGSWGVWNESDTPIAHHPHPRPPHITALMSPSYTLQDPVIVLQSLHIPPSMS